MQNNRFILASLLALALTACGGGGGDDGVQVNQATKPNQSTTVELRGEINIQAGGALKFTNPKNDSMQTLNILDAHGENLIIVPDNNDGKIYDGIEAYDSNTKVRRLVGANLSYARWGIISFTGKNKEDIRTYRFFNGIPTVKSDLPKGTAQYKGYAVASIHVPKADTAYITETDTGTSLLNVDFSKKEVDLEITLKKNGKLTFDKATFTDMDGKTYYDNYRNNSGNNAFAGAFYGSQAAETAGLFGITKDNKHIEGAFGAKKTE